MATVAVPFAPGVRPARALLTGLVAVWFALPFLPLVLWMFADQWSFPSVFPTHWGTEGISSALAQGAAPAFARSVLLSVLVAAIATPLGALAARALVYRWAPLPKTLTAMLFAPVLIPPLAATFGANVLILRAQIPALVGLVIVLVAIALPYTTFSMRVAYAAHDIGFEEQARTLGASRARVLWRVHVPLLAPALARSAFLAFLVAWSDYIVTVIVGAGQVVTLPLVTASVASGVGGDATVAVLSMVAVLPPIVLLLLLATGGGVPGRRARWTAR